MSPSLIVRAVARSWSAAPGIIGTSSSPRINLNRTTVPVTHGVRLRWLEF